ncbi:14367_t:CDS:2 [Gigaspora margarita]|uniref:14367_t:CDS:1 n=1 Tax=Gigaspora margarita TaxID=4874 RepID=A0ABM8W1K4_GIGMA|nr:14367_t:CDS:2 [Gigaspora margarita]
MDDDESGAIHSQADYTSRFISHDELEIINSRTSGVTCINDNNNKIIESQEDNIPIEYMEKLMLKIDKVAE